MGGAVRGGAQCALDSREKVLSAIGDRVRAARIDLPPVIRCGKSMVASCPHTISPIALLYNYTSLVSLCDKKTLVIALRTA